MSVQGVLPLSSPPPALDCQVRVWLVGEHNPYGQDPEFALYPLPSNATGGRLARVLGLSRVEYLSAFEVRRNLLDTAKWSVVAARRAADAVLAEQPQGDKLLLLGARVSAAFGVDFRSNLYEAKFMQVGSGGVLVGRWVLVAPHPSGLSREWNSPHAAPKVRAGFAALKAAGAP